MTKMPELNKIPPQDIGKILNRRKSLILGVTFCGFLATSAILYAINPTYTAETTLLYRAKDIPSLKTQEIYLKSNALAQKVMRELALLNTLDLNDPIEPQSPSSFKSLNLYTAESPEFSDALLEDHQQSLIKTFLNNFTVNIIPHSYILQLRYKSQNPQTAVKVLHGIMEAYINTLKTQNDFEPDESSAEILELLKENLENLKRDLNNFNTSYTMGASDTTYEQARIEYAAARAQIDPFLDQNRKMIYNEKAPALVNSKLLQKLKRRQISLGQQWKELSTRYGLKHPRMIAIASELSMIQTHIIQETNNILARVKGDYDIATARIKALRNTAQETTTHKAERNKEHHNILAKHVASAQQIYDAFKNTYEESKQHKVEQTVQILAPVALSDQPLEPNKNRLLVIGTFLSFLISLIAAFFFETRRKTLISGREAEAHLNLPCFALIPEIYPEKNKPIADYVTSHPSSTLAEAVRSLRLTLKLSNPEGMVIAMTSSLPDEGKTTLSAWLARSAAKSGERVILIDADLRRPSVHKVFEHENTISLVEYLTNQKALAETIDKSDPSGLHILYGRCAPNSALDLLTSQKMRELIKALREEYDLIIIDSPACMAVSDARAITQYADQILYAITWNKTSRELVHSGVSQFLKVGNTRISTVLTHINLKKYVEFGYGNAINYYGRYKAYKDR